jgi:DNA-directed RNA polymerase specialized sigma24 family protein
MNSMAHTHDGVNSLTRAVVILIKLEQMKAATVAEMLGISVSAVNKHLANAVAHLSALRKRLDSP